MTRVFSLIIYLLIVVLALVFALLNPAPATFNYYFGRVDLPVSLLVVLSVACGAALGVLASLGMVIRARRHAWNQRRQVRNCEKELDQLRALTQQDKQSHV